MYYSLGEWYEKSFFSPKSFNALYSLQYTAFNCYLLRLPRNSFCISSLECNYRKPLAHLLQLHREPFTTMAFQFVHLEVKLKEITSFVWMPFCEVRETDLHDIPSKTSSCKVQFWEVWHNMWMEYLISLEALAAQARAWCITVTINSVPLYTN